MRYIYKPFNIYSNISDLSYKGIGDNSIFFYENIVDSTTTIQIDNQNGISPSIETFIKAIKDTITFEKCNNLYSSNSIFVFLYLDFENDTEESAIYKCDIDGNNLINNIELLQAGKFFSNHKFLPESINREFFNFNVINNHAYRSLLFAIASPIDSLTIRDGGSGYKLNSIFSLIGQDNRNLIKDKVTIQDASISVDLSLHQDTINISGGENYQIGDIFSIQSAPATSGEIKVSTIDSNGAILTTELINPGLGFTSQPSVIYNGNTGTNAVITHNDTYIIGNVSLLDKGNGYLSLSLYISATDQLGQDYKPENYAVLNVQAESSLGNEDIIINNKFALQSVNVTNPGNNFHDNSEMLIKSDFNKSLDFNNFYAINNLIDVEKTDPNKIRQYFDTLSNLNITGDDL